MFRVMLIVMAMLSPLLLISERAAANNADDLFCFIVGEDNVAKSTDCGITPADTAGLYVARLSAAVSNEIAGDGGVWKVTPAFETGDICYVLTEDLGFTDVPCAAPHASFPNLFVSRAGETSFIRPSLTFTASPTPTATATPTPTPTYSGAVATVCTSTHVLHPSTGLCVPRVGFTG